MANKGDGDNSPTPVGLGGGGPITVVVPDSTPTYIGGGGGGQQATPTRVKPLPLEAVVTERDAQGGATAYTLPSDKQNLDLPREQGQTLTKHFTPLSTSYQLGVWNTNEDINRSRNLGIHAGRDVPSGTILLLDNEGNPYRREHPEDIARSAANSTLQSAIRSGKYTVPVKAFDGNEIYLTPKEATALQEAKPRDQFDLAVEKGLIPKDSEFVPGDNGEWKYQKAGTYQSARTIKGNQETFERNNVKLDTGESVSLKDFEKLTAAQRNYLSKEACWVL
jgi:hypothetical protein